MYVPQWTSKHLIEFL